LAELAGGRAAISCFRHFEIRAITCIRTLGASVCASGFAFTQTFYKTFYVLLELSTLTILR